MYSTARIFLRELPLDKYSANALRIAEPTLPRWDGVKHLTPEANAIFQIAALDVARKQEVARVDLDVLYWRTGTLPGDDGFVSKPYRRSNRKARP
jgi:hypothetical protein